MKTPTVTYQRDDIKDHSLLFLGALLLSVVAALLVVLFSN